MEKKTKKRNMEMTNEEIVKSWREAKDRRAQIKVLAELNVCPQELIIEILKEGGVDPRQLPRKKKAAPFVLTSEGGQQGTPVPTNAEGEATGVVADDVKAGEMPDPTNGEGEVAEACNVVVVEPAEGIIAEALAWYRADLVRTVNKLREEYDTILADYAVKISEIDMKLAGVRET